MQRRKRTNELSPLFRSALQAEILAFVFTSSAETSVSEIAEAIGRERSQTAREVGKLITAGLLSARVAGRTRIVVANSDSPIYDAIAKIVTYSYGPRHVIAAELQPIEGVEAAWIFGSWAARYQGQPGPPPADIDVLVIGGADTDDVWEACMRAARRLGREVNPRVIRSDRWEARDDPFLVAVRSRPMVQLAI